MEQRDFDLVDTAVMHSGYPLAIGAWGRIRKEYAEALKPSHNSHVMQLLCDVKGLLLNNDTPSREARAEIIGAINAVLAQQHT